MATTQLYHIRPGRHSDLKHATRLYVAAFGPDMLPDILFPSRHERPQDFVEFLRRTFDIRWWTPQWDLAVVCDPDETPVGFTWWKRPLTDLSVWERWLSPYALFSCFVRAFLNIKTKLISIPSEDKRCTGVFDRVCRHVFPEVVNTPRRKQAHYLSTLAVDPKLHGLGLGTMLLNHGLAKVDQKGLAAWLIGLAGTDKYYSRFGFSTVGNVNVGELSHWDGGFIMFRE